MRSLYHDALQLLRNDGLLHKTILVWSPTPYRWPRLDNNLILPRLSVEIPLSVGKAAWVLQSSIHNEAPNSDKALTLGQGLIKGQTRWSAMTKVLGEFYFTDCYWEWLELVVG
ncbi:putative mitochondrial protein [Cucumis melo var. makuwa]|uniref:Mitochondrial protein n=1 Tax=Cucumis melo var. makuwa TaxID=1194695 RepID=A0A5D3BEE5_CUCMM|nr:putative mitochondrial protein [Cucumis melo var. makuwa]TYJ96815.1 putative mitochondrial protein [Cucumis melo var. makuwa]